MTRYAITHINREGRRVLSVPNQGRYLRTTPEDASKHLEAVTATWAKKAISEIYGPQAIGTFKVSPIECWRNGDAKGIYVKEPPVTA